MPENLLRRHVLPYRGRCFVTLCVAFAVFGGGTLNLFMLLQANLRLVAEHGWMALADGGARQLLELLLSGTLSMAAYVIFKACEYRLVRELAEGKGR